MPSLSPSLLRISPSFSKKPSISISFSYFTTITSAIKDVQFHQSPPIIHRFLSFLQEFSKSFNCIRCIHAQIITIPLSTDEFLATKLVKSYSDLGNLREARHVFDQITEPKTFLWNAMMRGYLRNDQFSKTLELYQMMRSHDLQTDSCTYNFALKACTSLLDIETGKRIIRNAVDDGLAKDRFLGSSMINFLMKFGNIDEARCVFDELPDRDVVCWNSIIGGYVKECNFDMAFDLFLEMQGSGIRPSQVTVVNLIQACGRMGKLEFGKCIHGYMNGLGMGFDILVLTSLVDMYGKLGDPGSARRVFDRMPGKNLVSWNAMISGYVQNGLTFEAFELFSGLRFSGSEFDSATIVSLLQASAQISSLDNGKVLHGCILRKGLESSPIVSTAIVDLYSKSGALKLASSVFSRMKERNVISWTAMLVGLAQNGYAEEALKLFGQMKEEGIAANAVTLASLIHACAHVGSLKQGRSVHGLHESSLTFF